MFILFGSMCCCFGPKLPTGLLEVETITSQESWPETGVLGVGVFMSLGYFLLF